MEERRRRFVENYLVTGNGAQAATLAGYSEKSAKVTASRLLTDANVRAAIARGQAERAERVQVTQDYVLTRLMMEAEREGEGSSHSARVAAIGLLGKHLIMFTDKTEHSGGLTVNIPQADAGL
jgi:phage terminase small subunit